MSESLEQPPHADPPVNDKSPSGDQMDTDNTPQTSHTEDQPRQNGDNAESQMNGGMKRHSPDHEEDDLEERNAKRAREDHSVSHKTLLRVIILPLTAFANHLVGFSRGPSSQWIFGRRDG
jgi:FtsZ-interacting cell division protein ZipA